jgi:NADH dehydrogenase
MKNRKKVIILGGGFAGLSCLRHLGTNMDIILVDQNNYHQFQPLLYQVAIGELEPSSIVFPYRNMLQNQENIRFVQGELGNLKADAKQITLKNGLTLEYEELIFALGTDNNFFNNNSFKTHCFTLKSLEESISLRNQIFGRLEKIAQMPPFEQEKALQWVIIGGGPTGIELGAILSQMRETIFVKEYPEIDFSKMCISLIEGAGRLLSGMSEKSSAYTLKYLQKIGLKIHLNTAVASCTEDQIILKPNTSENIISDTIPTGFTLWTAGIQAREIEGLGVELGRGKRILVDRQHKIKGFEHLYCLGDQALMVTEKYPQGHPQVAQVALQQGKHLAEFLNGKHTHSFEYNDKGSMAILGKKNAVVDIGRFHFNGLFAWFLWSLVHIFSIIGVKNRLFVFINWIFFYFSNRSNLRIISNVD